MKKGIIFDLDGTLWDSTAEITTAWQTVADNMNLGVKLDAKAVKSCMGLPMDKIFEKLFPAVGEEKLSEIRRKCEQYENEYLSENSGALYPKTEEVLNKLKSDGFDLFIVSNSQDGYVEAFFSSTGLEYLFDDYETFGRTGLQKSENIKSVVKRNNLDFSFYVGDTLGDFEAAEKSGLPFVFAEYGFGNVKNSSYKISSLEELINFAIK